MKLNQKNKILIAVFVLLLYFSYTFAVSKTIEIFDEYTANSKILEAGDHSPGLALKLQQREKQLDFILSQYKVFEPVSFQNDLLKELNSLSSRYRLKIVDFQEPHIVENGDVLTTSYVFSLQGSFNGSLALLNKLENNRALGSITHVNFTKKKNYKNNADELFTEVILKKDTERRK